MPLNRYQIRNEYSLANPELYKVVDKDDPEALLEGVAMAGLVGVLRQLGDLAEFAAEVFHDLHEEVMATAARGHNLIVRARQLEAEFPSIERTLLTQTSHTSFLYNSGVDWHPNLCMDQNLVTRGDVPRFVRDSHEECRGPPRLFLLDKFDVAGAGACLKRYTDPSFFKTVSMSSNGGKSATQREKKIRRVKKRASRWRNGDTPESFPSSHAKLHQLFLEENLESGGNGPERRVKLKRRQFTGLFFDHDNKNSYMEKFVDMSPPGQKIATLTDECESGLEIVEIGTVSPIKESIKTEKDFSSSPGASKLEMTPSVDNFTESKLNEVIEDGEVEMHGLNRGSDTCKILKLVKSGEYFDIESSSQASVDGFASEIDNYLDAQATNESEVETDSECKRISHYLNVKPNVAEFYGSKRQRGPQSLSSDSQSIGNSTTSEVGNNFSRERENSSCSVSMSSTTESTKDLDAAIVAVPSFPTSKSDPDDISSDHHFASEGIPLIETEKHAVFDNGFAEADDYRKSTSNTSCLTGPNTINLPIEMEASQGENCLSSSKLDEEHSNFDNSGIFANQSGPKNNVERHLDNEACHDSGARAEAKHDLSNTLNDLVYMSQTESRKAESGSSSVEENSNELATAELDASSDVGQTLAHLPTSDAKHRETISPIDVNVDFFVSPAQHNSEGQYFAPESTKTLNILEQFSEANITGHGQLLDSALGDLPRSQEDHSPKELLNDLEAEVKASSASIVGLTEAVDTADWDHLEADRLGSLSPGDEPNCEIVSESADEKLVNISTTMVKPSMVPDLRGDHNRWQKLESEVHEAAPLDCHEAEASELCSGNNSTFNGGVVSVVENGQDSAMNAGIPEKASVFQNLTSSQQYQQEFVGNEAYLDESGTQAMLSDAASQHFSPIVEATNGLQGIESTFSCHIHPDKEKEFYADSLSHDEPNTTKCLQDIESKAKPLHADELSLQSINCPSPIQIPDFDRDRCTTPSHSYAQVSVDNFMQLSGESTSSSITNVLSGSSQCIQKVDNPGQLLCPSFPVLNMLSAEPPTSLEPPPLPPLPPMQWRLGRLQNPSTGVQRKMVQHTPGLVLPVAFPRSNVKSDIVATLPRTRVSDVSSENKTVGIGEDNHSYVNFETTVNVQNGDQFSESEESCNRSIDPPESGSTPEAHASENCLAVEEKSNTEIGSENGQPECISQGAETETDNSVELSQSLTTHYDSGQQPGFTAFESGNILPSTHGFSINEDGNPNGSLQNKPSRPRNPLIDEVVAIDKSKLRKVGERTKPQAESKTEDVGSLLEQLQLRKVSDMVKQEVDRKPEETESPRLQLRKVVGRAYSTVGPKTEDRDSLLEQIRNKSFNLKPAATARPNFQFQGPRTNLKVAAILQKASNIRQAMAGSDEEDDADNWSDC